MPPASSQAAFLIFEAGPRAGETIDLCGLNRLELGRGADAPLRIRDQTLSTRHAEFRAVEDGYVLVDLGSTNGTYVNGRKVGEAVLSSGDEIRVGESKILFSYEPGATETTFLVPVLKRGRATRHAHGQETPEYVKRLEREEAEGKEGARERLRCVYRVGQALAGIGSDDPLASVVEVLVAQHRPSRACLGLVVPGSESFELAAAHGEVARDGRWTIHLPVLEHVVRTGEPVLHTEARPDERFAPGRPDGGGPEGGEADAGDTDTGDAGTGDAGTGDAGGAHAARSVLASPIVFVDRILGVIYLDHVEDGAAFDPGDRDLLTSIGRQVGIVVSRGLLEQMLVRRDKWSSLALLVSGISSRVQEPLRELVHRLEELRSGAGAGDREGAALAAVNDLARDADATLGDLMRFAQAPAESRITLDVRDLIAGALNLADDLLQATGAVVEQRIEDEHLVNVDPAAVQQLFVNLVQNACEALADVEGERRIEVRVTEWKDRVLTIVTDSGPGVPVDLMRKVFDPFFTTKVPCCGSGSGLGLSTALGIAREHGGDLYLRPGGGAGARFVVELPQPGSAKDAVDAALPTSLGAHVARTDESSAGLGGPSGRTTMRLDPSALPRPGDPPPPEPSEG